MTDLFRKSDSSLPFSVLREFEEWGLRSVDLVAPPRRLWRGKEQSQNVVEEGTDIRRLSKVPTPTDFLVQPPTEETWQSLSRRSVARLNSYFLALEDPQRRLDVREVETLSHQVSLVRHILETDKLRSVLVADEVGLGKTVEVGLLLKELFTLRPSIRVLYLAPARLVANVRREFDRLNLSFRQWSAADGDARLTDPRIIASIHRAVVSSNFDTFASTIPWDVLIVDECHHLSAWSPDGTDARQAYKLVSQLIQNQPRGARLVLMSGTPHQGHQTRFENLLLLLKSQEESLNDLAGRVIYRTKDDIQDWDGNPVFPKRRVNEPLIVDLGSDHRKWLNNIFDFYRPPKNQYENDESRRRAAGWRCAQAMQWATSSPQAGLGYLVRQAIRAGWDQDNKTLRAALTMLRPYRLGPENEDIDRLYIRISKEVDRQEQDEDIDDIENFIPGQSSDPESQQGLERLLKEGIKLVETAGDEKLNLIFKKLLEPMSDEKVVLFAQPIETVTALARYLQLRTGQKPSLIIGGQSDDERTKEVNTFWDPKGTRFLVSSKAGGEGINLQVARRLIHIDIPWNPMDMEQRVGRVHRFGSRETVIVDTVVVKDSREWDAYRVAREKLALITRTLVESERFESVFSRVMSLLSQDDFTNLMVNGFGAPLSGTDRDRLAELVQQGFQKWKDFHQKYGTEQSAIKTQDAGLATWDDLKEFLASYAGAEAVPGYTRQSFARDGDDVRPVQTEAQVLRLGSGNTYVCADYGEFLVYSPDGRITPKLGLNDSSVGDSLAKTAFPDGIVGPAYLRWPDSVDLPSASYHLPFGVLALARQTLQQDLNGVWNERRVSMHVYVSTGHDLSEIGGPEKGKLMRGIFRGVIRKTSEPIDALIQSLSSAEKELVESLRRPTETDLQAKVRHAVTPIFAAIVTE